jgi:hypothetical protein
MYRAGQVPVVAENVAQGASRGLECWAGSRCYNKDGYAGECDVFTAYTFVTGRWLFATGFDEDVIHAILRTATLVTRSTPRR